MTAAGTRLLVLYTSLQMKIAPLIISVISVISVVALSSFLAGCTSPPRTDESPLVATEYAKGFDAVQTVLHDYRFELERIDARHGVITTRPKPSAGLISPWDKEQSTMEQKLETVVNQEFRSVRVQFQMQGSQPQGEEKTLTPSDTADADLTDLRTQGQPMQITVVVNVSRMHHPGRLPSTKSIRSTTYYQDPALVTRGVAPSSIEELGRDPLLESRLLASIEKELARPVPAPAPAATAPEPTTPSP